MQQKFTYEAATGKTGYNDGDKAAHFPGGANKTYINISGAEGASLLQGKDNVVISMYVKDEVDSSGKANWLYYASPHDHIGSGNTPTDRNYIGLYTDAKDTTIKSERGPSGSNSNTIIRTVRAGIK